eukprot:4841195-Prymnesium_polylepis.1
MGRGWRNLPFMNTPFMNTFTFTFAHGSRPAKPPVHEHPVHLTRSRSRSFMGRGRRNRPFMNT